MKIISLSILMVMVLQLNTCHKKKSSAYKDTYTDFGTCYNDRETIKVLDNIKGKIIKVTDNLWAIQPDEKASRLGICQIPEELKKENLLVIFSGEIKKIAPNEKFAASPFQIKELKVIDN